ncbi:MAG: hypothetical protein WA655_02720 [Candidatus Korobacteraceae bacterium]
MTGKRILYVCFDPALVLSRERALLSKGYDVSTVLGHDGLMAARELGDFDLILIGDEGSLPERSDSIRQLKEQFFPHPIIALCHGVEHIPDADYQISTGDPKPWSDAVEDCLRECQDLV